MHSVQQVISVSWTRLYVCKHIIREFGANVDEYMDENKLLQQTVYTQLQIFLNTV